VTVNPAGKGRRYAESMKSNRRARRDRRVIVIVLVVSCIISALVGRRIAPAEASDLASAVQGIVSALVIAGPILMLEIYGMQSELGERMRRLPLPAYLGVKMLFYAVIIVGGQFLVRAIFLVLYGESLQADAAFTKALIFGGAMAVTGNLIFELGGLLGWGTLKSLLTGRYAVPRAELKTFLLIDMKDSTGLAERLGPIRFHQLLNDFFRDISHAALECGAEIHKYVGDEAILTWADEAGLADGAALSCSFIVCDFIAAHEARYRERFGAVPTFRAALHCGEIVAGEIGDLRREVAYVGDTLNVAARLLDATKTLGRDVLVSAELLRRATLPDDLRAEELPMLEVRGRAVPLGISALDRISASP
jgi:adenylate cyclase